MRIMSVKRLLILLIFLVPVLDIAAQNWAQIKKDIEASKNSPLYVKDILKKPFSIDTVAIARLSEFESFKDSIAFHGELGKVYGPFGREQYLVQVLAENPNQFNRVGQIFIDTAIIYYPRADSLANFIIRQIAIGNRSFEDMASTYSMGGEGATQGDLGWIAAGYTLPQLDKALLEKEKGDLFKMWTRRGVHIIRKSDHTQTFRGYALLLMIRWKS